MIKFHSDITLQIDLGAIKHNYSLLAKMAKNSVCSAVAKANAYGLGVDKVANILYSAGCRNYFVATLDEALELAGILGPDSKIYVFHGVKPGEEDYFEKNGLIPVINDFYQLETWATRARDQDLKLPAILHFDTGMNRLGFNWQDGETVAKHTSIRYLDIKYIMSHLVAAEDKSHSMNKQQIGKVEQIKKHFPKIPVSLANSWGIIAGDEFHYDMVRPGCALYGVKGESKIDIKNVITAKAKVIQVRDITENGFVGYGATKEIKKGARIAVCPLGYADGYLRSLSNNSYAYFGKYKLPLVGRVSMDLTIFDISKVPTNEFRVGDELELIGENYTVDDVANNAGTIGYEILTSLGNRYERVYR